MSMTGTILKTEVLTGPERRRRWAPAEKLSITAETSKPGMTVSLVARHHGIATEPVVRVAAAGEPGRFDGNPGRRRGRSGLRVSVTQNQIRELQAASGQEDP